ncbi:MAG TPA: cytochrome C [Nitratifractor sp.]|nr:cytochrome C [Nitratifractor sp.]
MKVLLNIFGWSLAVLLLLQFIQIEIPTPPKATPQDEIKAPKEVMALLKNSCYDCHSNNTKFPWYSDIAPISWQVHANIKNGRAWMNFSTWSKYDEKKKQKFYKGIVDALNIKMPPAEYLLIHKDARLSPKERKLLQDWAQKFVKED